MTVTQTRTSMQVRKRNGDNEPVDVNKIVRAVDRVSGDLADVDPMRVATRTGSLPLSFSFHKETGGVFFAVTDRAAVRGELEIIAMTGRQLDEARAAEDENAPSRDVRIVAPEVQGFVIVRVIAPAPSLRPQAEEMAKAVSCTAEPDA